MDYRLARFLLMYYVDMFKLMERLHLNPREHGNMFCPFHNNIHTPSSKLYKDKYGWVLFCFNEKKIFTTWDVYEKVMGIDPMVIAKEIWNKLTDEQKKEIENISGSQEDFAGDVPFMDELEQFKQGKMSYNRLCIAMALKL